MPGRLVLSGDFTVMDSQQRHLQQQATRLGFADLRGCLRALLDGWSVPQLAAIARAFAGEPPGPTLAPPLWLIRRTPVGR